MRKTTKSSGEKIAKDTKRSTLKVWYQRRKALFGVSAQTSITDCEEN
ncbi:hypothetical protein [uncultured Shimia sp.]|nr:hypothetical protein [uncultured Shimia sp.]